MAPREERNALPHSPRRIAHASPPPWRVKTAIAFTDREQPLAFERYLILPSGRAFARKQSPDRGGVTVFPGKLMH